VAVGPALFALFTTRNYVVELYSALTQTDAGLRARILNLTKSKTSRDPIGTADEKLKALEKRLELEAEAQKYQNFYLAIATAIGTIFWGFGDLFALWLRILIYGAPT
jgi:hypothetical protein